MSKRLQEVLADVRDLPDDAQDLVAQAISVFLREWQDYQVG